MSPSRVREPVQQRSIEKKRKILDAGYELFCKKGFHNTNTAEIAKEAGVSTGIVYNYFENKRDIFKICIERYAADISRPVYDILGSIKTVGELRAGIAGIIDRMIDSHSAIKTAHEEMQAMAHGDPEIAEYFEHYEEQITKDVVELLINIGVSASNLHEKVHIIYNMIEDLCHEAAYHNHECMNPEVMKKEVLDIIFFVIKIEPD